MAKRNKKSKAANVWRPRNLKRKKKKEMEEKLKKELIVGDRGSYYSQKAQWPEEFPDKSASRKKLGSPTKKTASPKTCKTKKPPNTNVIVNPSNLQKALENCAICSKCKRGGLKIVQIEQVGLGEKWQFSCSNPFCSSVEIPYEFCCTPKTGNLYDINRTSVLAFRAIGRGRTSADKVCSVLNLTPPIASHHWAGHTKFYDGVVIELLEVELRKAAWELKCMKREIGDFPDYSDEELQELNIDVAITIDGAWSSRGWTSRDGMVAVISVDTGKVLDVLYMSSSCVQCQLMEEKKQNGELSAVEYFEWYIRHDTDCYLNHSGSSAAMEAAGAVKLFRRSIELRGLRYNPYVGDGDSKAYVAVTNDLPYGTTVYIQKQDCISHVTKRMGTGLRALVRDYKGKKLTDGKALTGAGRLTIARIDSIQGFYGTAIRANKGDAKAMAKATRAILKHYSDVSDDKKHEDCPTGFNSWCSYKKDKAGGTKNHKPIKNPFPPAVVEVIQPLFNRLGSEQFLAGCEKCLTQNANESLHHVVWGMAPKDQHRSQAETRLATHLGVLLFNNGFCKTFSGVMGDVSLNMKTTWERIDQERIRLADYKAQERVKIKRKKRKHMKAKKQDGFVRKEGVMYKSQSFYDKSSSKTKKTNGKKRKATSKNTHNDTAKKSKKS